MKEVDSKEIIETLQEAGAGISPFKRLIAKHVIFPMLNRFISWEKAGDIYDREGTKIIALVSPLSKEKLFERVLVPKLFGLEDNSRYYSVAMVIKHLLIVGNALQTRIPLLSQGRKLNDQVQIEDVKPYTEIEDDIVQQFETFLASYRKLLNKNVKNIYIDNTSAHPWFGEFNPKQWSILGMVHQIVHRRQIEAIIKEL
ncbi:hypothetical protein YH65_06875 [Sulfurovum lithotrophicum]|uniref:DinB-like domain-containing protein n=1 Tax=Sulfurovum lithotrophicum TaxID=206403 RepID=A0A7U4M1L0_9BACT|nr:DinB family protein [Sulfurovum lithotrophicum]AKF25145.1 hypothetical protein YH65_06875 [Sulfurovum lithotrophicum]